MKHYRFAHLFVHLSRRLGVLIVLGGLAYAAYRGYVRFNEASTARYRKSSELDMLLTRVEIEGRSVTRILQSGLSAIAKGTPLEFPSVPKGANTTAQMERILDALQQVERKADAAKAKTVEAFEQAIEELRKQLLRHAEAIAGPKIASTGKPVTRNPQSDAAAEDKDNLFTNLSNEARRRRIEEMGKVWSYLDQLQKVSEQDENKARLNVANYNLLELLALIPAPLEIKPQSESVSSGPTIKMREDTKAEQVAEALLQATRIVRQSVLEPWKLNDALDRALTKASAEKQLCEIAEERSKALYLSGCEEGIIIAVLGVVFSFLVLVMADFLQTQLDIAQNTRLAAETLDKATIETAI